jgi:hypothetical protein
VSYYCDNDSDGYKDASVDGSCTGAGCQPAGCQTTPGNDCNDTDAAIHPGAVEICDGKNNDCNAGTPDGSGESWYGTACDGPDTDLCKEGTYGCTAGAQSCSDTTGNTAEVCTGGLDEDCDGKIDCADSNCASNPACCTPAIGSDKSVYHTDEVVYLSGSCLPPGSNVDFYIVQNLTWSDGMAIPSDLSSDGVNTFTTDVYGSLSSDGMNTFTTKGYGNLSSNGMNSVSTNGAGNLGTRILWQPPLTPGEYDIVADVNRNGFYDVGIDYVNNPNHPGFTVVAVSGGGGGGNPEVGGFVFPVNKFMLLSP